jgi:hypothetical protein
MGPTLLLDKSALESLSVDEAVWLDMFFGANITPLLYVETLADLEKTDAKKGRSGEQIVAQLAGKTPVNSTFPNAHHFDMLLQDLHGNYVPIDKQQVIITGGEPRIDSDGNLGVHIDEFPEQAALNRWFQGDFLEIERKYAKSWRNTLNSLNPEVTMEWVKNIVPPDRHFSNLTDIKAFADEFVRQSGLPQLNFMLQLLSIQSAMWHRIQQRYISLGQPSLVSFAPYAAYVLKIEIFYYLCLRSSFISKDRASNKADIAYLYYLPFCHAFVSKDNLHVRTAQLFMEHGQTFVNAEDLKVALKGMDDYYAPHMAEIEAVGLMSYVSYPPADVNSLVTQLWDTHMRPDWRDISRNHQAKKPDRDMPTDKEFMKQIKKQRDESKPVSGPVDTSNIDYTFISRKMSPRRGKWQIISPEIERQADDGKG